MRTTLNIDADAYDFAAVYANAKGISLGAAVSELLRKIESMPKAPDNIPTRRLKAGPRGYLVKAKTGRVVTPEMVKRASEDDLA
jgi:hypothetical protein